MKIKDIIILLDDKLKLKVQELWDNGGLQIGDSQSEVQNVMLSLDMSKEVVQYAIGENIDLIITHHPFIFKPMKSIDFGTYDGQVIRDMILNNINLYSIHTSFDMADYGVNKELGNILGFENYEILNVKSIEQKYGYGGIADVSSVDIMTFSQHIKKLLKCDNIKLYCNNKRKIVKKVAFCGGSGGSFIYDAIAKEADVYISGDITYHEAQFALKNDICIIDAGHYNTECHSLHRISDVLNDNTNLKVDIFTQNTVNEIII